MSLAAFAAALEAQLLADAGLAAWRGRPLTAVRGNALVAHVQEHEMPALVLELGDAETGPQVQGRSQDVETAVEMAVVWLEQDADTAWTERLALPDLVVRAVMADHTLGGVVQGAWVSEWESDRNAGHPVHVMRFSVAGEYRLDKV